MDFHGNPVYFEKPAAPHTKEVTQKNIIDK